MATVKEARAKLAHEFIRGARDVDGLFPGESDAEVNRASEELVKAMKAEHGEAWLGQVNLYGEQRGKPEHALWKWDGSTIYTFGSSFVAPRYDEELVRLIMKRDTTPYTTTAADAVRVDAIHARLEEIGGVTLFWT